MLFQDKLLTIESVKVNKLQCIFKKYEIMGFDVVTVISGLLFQIQLNVLYVYVSTVGQFKNLYKLDGLKISKTFSDFEKILCLETSKYLDLGFCWNPEVCLSEMFPLNVGWVIILLFYPSTLARMNDIEALLIYSYNYNLYKLLQVLSM